MPSAISQVGGPDPFSPGYNPNIYYFDSTDKTQPGFRYIVHVNGATGSPIYATYKLAPRPGDGYAVFDMTRFLKDHLTYNVDNLTGIQKIPESWFAFTITVEEEFNVPWLYDNFNNPSGDVTSLTSSNTQSFAVGDVINVSQADFGAEKPMLQGIFTVTDIISSTEIAINIPFSQVGTGSTMGGSVIYADNRKTIPADVCNVGPQTVFNGSLEYTTFPSYSAADYSMLAGGVNIKFLSNCPANLDNKGVSPFYVYPTQDLRFNYANLYTNDCKYIFFLTDDGSLFRNTAGTINTEGIVGAMVGPNQTPTLVSGTSPMIKPTTEFYYVYCSDDITGANIVSEIKQFWIDRRCRIEPVELLFLDRMGSLGSFAFELRNHKSITAVKSEFRKLQGDLDGGHIIVIDNKYTYDLTERGATVNSVDFNETYEINTNWMDDASSVYFEELKSSPEVYMKYSGEWSGYRAVIVTNFEPETVRQKDKHLIRYTLTIKFATSDAINI